MILLCASVPTLSSSIASAPILRGVPIREVVLYIQQYLAYLESIGAEVVNGYHSYLIGASKAMQLDYL